MDSSLPRPSPWSLPKQLNTRRLFIASIFAIISILRWDRDLTTPISTTAHFDSSSPSSPALPLATVAYAVSITKCSPKLSARLYDAAVVLKRSIELNSWPLHPDSRYAAKFYAFTLKPADNSDPATVDRCYQVLTLAGFEVVPQDPPLYPQLIKEPEGSVLKMGIGGDGCCGGNELIKLATYKLTDHEMAVHLDLDTLVIHPLDELFNVMHFGSQTGEGKIAREKLGEVMAPTYLNRRLTGNPSKSGNMTATEMLANITVDAYFTKDYNMIIPGKQEQRVGVQGGFLTVRPSLDTYTHLISLVYSGEFYGGFDARTSGWLRSGYGKHIWGSMTIQGLMAYYFDVEQLEHSVELNRCRYNNIADNARVSSFAKNPKFPRCTLLPFVRNATNPRYNFDDKQCRDGRDKCDDTDCQRFPLEKARVLHYTYCKNPWNCNSCEYLETYKEPMCYAMLREWFRVRSTLPGEGNRTTDRVKGDDKGPLAVIRADGEVELTEGNCFKEFYLGYCMEAGKYDPMKQRDLSVPDVVALDSM
mmetsp:Transcript_18231/g.33223  ORF Transcript_18231/g.33223 Transcript_18231/m.33223 type:complete len:531 (+) Transcript_18231:12-1604(+)|eukprot:CAMPEP_0201897882 /NCGR_PEP_ID=MMETSP0902-20130614/47470_1 /ASSEMBLY_ACC=CAM_ASM_000551 /TAXON_ID=420261 /ORGANISM="Thalassiosira antarctica, Strain CCMP982" /LENGTH=530 /DNA_ID=CAMNT_0048430871 /DNA_START=12 /DNA_END=1604 /DNA_ORIENTATION=-